MTLANPRKPSTTTKTRSKASSPDVVFRQMPSAYFVNIDRDGVFPSTHLNFATISSVEDYSDGHGSYFVTVHYVDNRSQIFSGNRARQILEVCGQLEKKSGHADA